jgi:hypothetical protein
MNVVRRTVDDQRDTLSVPDYAAHVGEKAAREFGR